MKFINLILPFIFWTQIAGAQASLLHEVYFNQSLTSKAASFFTKKNGETYNKKNWLNPALHNIYMVNNRSEAEQHRIGLQNISRLSEGRIRFIDMLGSEPLDWSHLESTKFANEVQNFHSIAGFETTNFEKNNAAVMVIFSSASHNLLSTTTLDIVADLTKTGFIVVMMEYPGYGGSLGVPSKANWQLASKGLIQFLSKIFSDRSIYLVGHSIGSAVALDVAAHMPKSVQGVISHAGIYNLKEASKDSSKFPMSDKIAPVVAELMASKENWDAGASLESLARNQTPTLILHGRGDFSVSFRHFELLTNKGAELRKKYLAYPFYSQAFDSSHEDFYANADYGPYQQIWSSVFNFISLTSHKK